MSYDLFAQEEEVIAAAQKLVAEGGFTTEREGTAFAKLLKSYEKLFKTTRRLVRLSDRNERELNAMAEKQRLAAEEISRKNRELETLSTKLSKYLSPQVYESIFSGRQEVKLASQRKKLTVFFSDLVAFTETADRMESEDLTHLLNHYLTEMSRVALEHGATIDKYIGDAIMIFFGDPETRGVREDALACVRMAIAMQRRMRELEAVWRDTGVGEALRCRIGISTGYCTVGNFGSEDRMDYTIIGGGVNLASRLEHEAPPGSILIPYETYALVRDEVHCKPRGEIRVRGLAYPVAVYEVIDLHADLAAGRRDLRADHPHLKLELAPDAMSAVERREAAELLRQAMRLLGVETQAGEDGTPTTLGARQGQAGTRPHG